MRSTHGGSPASGSDYVRRVSAVVAAVDGLATDDITGWSDDQAHDGLLSLLPVVNQLCATVSTLVASFDTRGLSERDACRTTRTWLTAFGRMSQGAATGWLARGRLLRDLPALAAAAGSGAVSAEHLRKVGELVDHVGVAAVRDLDPVLADLASTTRPAEVGAACDRIRAHVDPDGRDPDPHAGERRGLSIARVGSLFTVTGKLDAEGGATLLTALDAMMRPPTPDDPRSAAQRRADAMVELARQALAGGTLPTVGGYRPQLGLLLTPDALLGARTTHTLPATSHHTTSHHTSGHPPRDTSPPRMSPGGEPSPGVSPPGVSPAGVSPGELLREGRGADGVSPGWRPPRDALECAGIPLLPELPWASWQTHLPEAVAQRIACDCEVWRIVLDPTTGLPLELGRSHRIVPAWLRKALHARDRGCRWPGCTAPTAWTDVHHLIAWYFHGPTNVDNCLLLCRFHHGLVHEGLPNHQRWRITLNPTTGEVHVHRPDGTPYELGPSQPWRPHDERRAPDRGLPRAA